jgi:SAM-dependent methyltransferase
MDDVLAEQIAYYRARAGEYDEWWDRRGQYALPPELERQWFADVAEAEAALREFGPAGRVLELACGTGLWTRRLVERADQVTAVDASPEVIALNRDRLGPDAPVEYVVADLFEWQPARASYDAVVFTYWLSHVPDDRLETFWAMVQSALAPGGRVFLVDSTAYPPRAMPPQDRVQPRELSDGRRFTVVKRYWTPDELAGSLPGWTTAARTTENQMMLLATVIPGP